MSDYLHWWIFMDSYEAILDKLTTDLKKVKIQKCKCGYLGTNFYGHIWRQHREFIYPEDGSILESAMMKLQVIRKNEHMSDLQETVDRDSIKNVGLPKEGNKVNGTDRNDKAVKDGSSLESAMVELQVIKKK